MLRAVTEDYLRRSGLDIKLDHGHIPGCVHPRVGAYATYAKPILKLFLSRLEELRAPMPEKKN